MSATRMGFGSSIELNLKGANKALERMFSPEFRNRLDAVVPFGGLPPEVIRKVVDKFLTELDGQLAEKKVTLEVTDTAKDWLAEKGYDPKFGARPMSRVIHDHIRKSLADELLFGKLKDGGTVVVGRKTKPDPLPDDWEDGLELSYPE